MVLWCFTLCQGLLLYLILILCKNTPKGWTVPSRLSSLLYTTLRRRKMYNRTLKWKSCLRSKTTEPRDSRHTWDSSPPKKIYIKLLWWLSSKERTCQCRRHEFDLWENTLEKEMAIHSSILAWKSPWTEEPQFSSAQSLSRVRLFATPWTTACQVSLSITNSRSPPKPMSIELVMPSNRFILCRPLLLLPSIFPSIRVFPNESALHIRWPKYWSFSFNISPSNEHPGLISFRMDWLDLLALQRTIVDYNSWSHKELDMTKQQQLYIY